MESHRGLLRLTVGLLSGLCIFGAGRTPLPLHAVEGTITRLELTSGGLMSSSLMLAAADGEQVPLKLNPRSTTLWEQGYRVPLTQLDIKDRVIVQYQQHDDQCIAHAVYLVQRAMLPQVTIHMAPPAPNPTGVPSHGHKKKY